MQFYTNVYSETVINVTSPLGYFLSYLYLFIIGSFLGWICEIFFRRIFSQHKWTNPGFLKGPCLPLYGFGLCLLYTICHLCFKYISNGEGVPDFYLIAKDYQYFGNLNFGYTSLISITCIGVGMTLLEFIAGLIFIKGFRIKLWDYSTLKGNIMGIICPLFSAIWLAVGALYWFFIHPYVNVLLQIFDNHIWGSTFVIGVYFGILIIDVYNSCKLAGKLSGVAKNNKLVVDLSKFQNNIHLDLLKKNGDNNWFEQKTLESAAKLKSKVGELTYDIKRHMYIGNEIPKVSTAESDETPRTKSERIKKENLNVVENQKNADKVIENNKKEKK